MTVSFFTLFLSVPFKCLLGAKKMFTGKTTLTPANIEEGKAFLKCMSYSDAEKVKSSEIFGVFEKIQTEDLSWPAVSRRH